MRRAPAQCRDDTDEGAENSLERPSCECEGDRDGPAGEHLVTDGPTLEVRAEVARKESPYI